MATYKELLTQAEPARHGLEARDRPRIAIGVDTSSIAVGALATLQALRAEVSRRDLDVDVAQVGGNGLSFANPVVELAQPDGTRILYQNVTAERVADFVAAVLAGNELDNEWLLGALSAGDGLKRMDEHAWWSIQTRRLMQDMGAIDPEDIDEAIARGAYAGLDRALTMAPEEVIAEVTASRLRGRSGSDFPTGRKWDFLRTSTTEPKAIVCNADEGDPGAWINRMTLENDPHALIEGVAIAAWATGSRTGYIYLREEYPLALERVVRAVQQARERGILGDRILDHDFALDIKVVRGAGSYVCGEESGLIASIEDARGMPKIRPPFPAASGVFGEGSNVNNVETFHSIAWLLRYGIEKYLEIDTGRNAGTMLFTLSGHVQRVGCFELPLGTPTRALFDVCGGGAAAGHSFKALQPGGPLAGILPEWSLDLPLEPEEYKAKGLGSMGGGGMVFLDDRACVIDLCEQFEWFLEDESCGRCTTCHGGTQRMVEILRRIQRGGGRESDVTKLRLLADTLRYSNCAHGQAAPAVIVNALDWFRDEFDAHIFERRCPAQVCHGLIRYEIADGAGAAPEHAEALARAQDFCPTGAVQRPDGGYRIEDALCIRCDVCRQLAPEAVRVVDAFEPGLGAAAELIPVQPAAR